MSKIMYSPYILSYITCFFGFVFFIIGRIIGMVSKRKEAECTIKTQGTVIENRLVRGRGSNDSDNYFAVVSYYANDEVYTRTSNVGKTRPIHKRGMNVTVCYDSKRPEKFFVQEEQYIVKRIQNIFTIIGSGTFIMAIVLAVRILFEI